MTMNDCDMKLLLSCIQNGFQECHRLNPSIKPYWKYRNALYELDGVVLYDDRVIIPPTLRRSVLDTFHAAHQGVSSMEARAHAIVFWPGITNDIDIIRNSCADCIKNAPSQARLPPALFSVPSTPFESIATDFFECARHHYLVIADRLSGWPDIFKCTPGSPQSGAQGLIACFRNCFACFGVPNEISSDGGPEFSAAATTSFLRQWGVHHRTSSAYHPQSNGRAEVAVKSAKRLLRSNIGPSGSLNTDSFLRAMLQLRNTPDPDCHLSPAQVVFGKPLRDSLAFVNRLEKFSNPHIRPIWREAWREKESALRQRYHRTSESLNEHSRTLPPLIVGDRCYVQNQTGNYPKGWDRSGTVVDSPGHDSYFIKVDGSSRVTRRNRQFLRKFVPVSPTISSPRPIASSTFPHSEEPEEPSTLVTSVPSIVDASHISTPTTVISQQPDITLGYESNQVNIPEPLHDAGSTSMPNDTPRPSRVKRQPRRFEPESGKWVP